MSTHFYLYCPETNECVEAVARVGGDCIPRIDANALSAFLAYHCSLLAVDLRIVNIDNLDDSELVWNEQNYHELCARNPKSAAGVADFEAGPSGGVWVCVPKDAAT